ncbi:MAG TPA: hypothetical protein VGJ63_11680 [Micromonosporaceae bacterium]
MSRVVRAGLALLGALYLAGGVPALVAPRWFFDEFPGFGHRWTAAYPPYNPHLVADLGATFVTLATLLLLAAWLADRRVAGAVLAGVLVFSTLHLVFHATHTGTLTGFDLAASLTALALGVLIPAVLLVAVLRWTRPR